ncbi:Hua2p [Saccharomyces paradoxus]|uniref:Hua2p n=1 Tax=Saccharomyces paradoxus TaxID=27291 RepID=A0A8B8V057_SACPA|nr:Hua2 [Saccharomyces paradoxus]QHS76368.1 Hua2 [Saccharomyces paradoxus]
MTLTFHGRKCGHVPSVTKLGNLYIREAMQQSRFGKICSDYDLTVDCSEDDVIENDRIILGYKRRLLMIENQMQHLLEDFSLDIQQIEPILVDLQRYYDKFLQLLQKRNKSLHCKNFTHQSGPTSVNSHTSTDAKVNLSGKLMNFQLNSGQKFAEENILRILQNSMDFKHYFQIDKGKKQKVLLLAVYQCLNGPARLHKVLNIDGIIHNNSIRTILGKQVYSSKWMVFLYDVKLVLLAHRQDVPNLETSKMIVRYDDLFPCALYFKDHAAY